LQRALSIGFANVPGATTPTSFTFVKTDCAGIEPPDGTVTLLIEDNPSDVLLIQESLGMADDKSKTRPEDAERVNVHEGYELEYWSKKFGCTKDQLKAAVNKVGVMAKDVEKDLKGK
jgi:hypothetical protein